MCKDYKFITNKAKIMNSHNIKTFGEYCMKLKEIINKKTKISMNEIELNLENCKYYYDNGFPVYYAFRESQTED